MKPFIKLHIALFVALVMTATSFSQDLPDKIRGYKVYNGKVEVSPVPGKYPPSGFDASVLIGEPKVAGISLTGMTIEMPAEVLASDQSGNVHFLTFHNFKINGISAEIEEYRDPFEFKKGQAVALPKPARIFLRADRIARAAWKEFTDSKESWLITGRVFVFGKFRKMGLSFKRVVPIDVAIRIKNPLTEFKKRS